MYMYTVKKTEAWLYQQVIFSCGAYFGHFTLDVEL